MPLAVVALLVRISLHVLAIAHCPALQIPPAQSCHPRQAFDATQGAHSAPPQSTSVSEPFFSASMQLAGSGGGSMIASEISASSFASVSTRTPPTTPPEPPIEPPEPGWRSPPVPVVNPSPAAPSVTGRSDGS